MHHQAGHVVGGEQQVRAERHVRAEQPHRRAGQVVARGHLPTLVELAVGGQVGLRRDAQHPPAVHDDAAVVDPVPVAQRSADHDHREQVRRRLDHPGQRGLDVVEQRVLRAAGRRSRSRTARAPAARRRATASSWQARAARIAASALAWGSATALGIAQAATRANPWR